MNLVNSSKLHKHHIIPRHAGGNNDPSNLILLTIPEHAEAHRLLFEEHGRWQDKMAWLALSGKTEEAEQVRIEATRTRMLNVNPSFDEKVRQKIRESKLGLAAWNKGTKHQNIPSNICEGCCVEFKTWKWRTQRFCSKTCSNKGHVRNPTGKNQHK